MTANDFHCLLHSLFNLFCRLKRGLNLFTASTAQRWCNHHWKGNFRFSMKTLFKKYSTWHVQARYTKVVFFCKLYSFVYKMSLIWKVFFLFIFSLKNKQNFEITYWNITNFVAQVFLVDIIAFARSWQQEQTGEENKGDKHSIDTIWHRDILLVNKHEKQYALWQLCRQPFFSTRGGKPENLRGSLYQSTGL